MPLSPMPPIGGPSPLATGSLANALALAVGVPAGITDGSRGSPDLAGAAGGGGGAASGAASGSGSGSGGGSTAGASGGGVRSDGGGGGGSGSGGIGSATGWAAGAGAEDLAACLAAACLLGCFGGAGTSQAVANNSKPKTRTTTRADINSHDTRISAARIRRSWSTGRRWKQSHILHGAVRLRVRDRVMERNHGPVLATEPDQLVGLVGLAAKIDDDLPVGLGLIVDLLHDLDDPAAAVIPKRLLDRQPLAPTALEGQLGDRDVGRLDVLEQVDGGVLRHPVDVVEGILGAPGAAAEELLEADLAGLPLVVVAQPIAERHGRRIEVLELV